MLLDQAILKAKKFSKKGKIEKAKILLLNINKKFPKNKRISLLLNSLENAAISNPSQQQLSSLLECYKNGQLGEAEKLALSITQEFPKHPFSWKVLGAVLEQTGRKYEALKANQNTVALSPQDAEAHNNLGNTLKELGRVEEAEASYTHAIKLNPDYVEAHHNLGIMLQELGRLEEAEASYTRAIELKPDFAEVHNNLGLMFQALGRLEEAEASYRRAIKQKHDYAEAHRHLVSMRKFVSKNNQFLKMQELYFDKNISEEQRCHINFGLAKACDDLEDFGQAFKHYSEGNAIRKKLLGYEISRDITIFNQLETSYARIEQKSLELDNLINKQVPIFIVGMPRSGTTLVEQIISSHSEVTGAGELSFATQFGEPIARGLSAINADSLYSFREKYLTKLQNISNGNLKVTDKMPQNFYYLGLLAATLPEAKILHVKRNPAAVCWANYKTYFASKKSGYCYALDDVITYYRQYESLMTFWTKQLPNRIYDVDYELLTVHQEDETRKLINFIGLNWEENCLSPQDNTRSVATASSMQVREKVYQGSSQQWKKYKPFLNGKLDCLDETIER